MRATPESRYPKAGRGLHKSVRGIHLMINGIWLGAVVSALVLVLAGSPERPAPYLAAFRLHDNLVVWAAGLVVFTGLFFALYTPWGLVRKWWVLGKWAGLLVLGLGIPFVVTPRMNALAAHADLALTTGSAGGSLEVLESRVLVLLFGEALLIGLLFALSTWRPRGETGLRWEDSRPVRIAVLAVALGVLGLAVATSGKLESARQTPLRRSSAVGLTDGPRQATVDWLGSPVRVEVLVTGGRVSSLRVIEQPSGFYTSLGALVASKVASEGDLAVDGVSGATTSARALLVAAAEALAEDSSID